MLPKYRVLVEQLAQRGLLKVICGTDTLGVGINVPIRTVLFTRLCKFDGQKTAVLSARDFHQIAGRAGGRDSTTSASSSRRPRALHREPQARREGEGRQEGREAQAARAQLRELGPADLQALMAAPPERLTSRFDVSHGMLLNVLSRRSDGCRAMQALIRDSHETDRAKKAHFRRGWQLFRALVERGIVEITPRTRTAPACA
jgi:superfamily II RNA helicase